MSTIKERINTSLSKLETSLNGIKTSLTNKNVSANTLKASQVPDKIREIELDPDMFTINEMGTLYSEVEGVTVVESTNNKMYYQNVPSKIVFTDETPPTGVKTGSGNKEDPNNKIITWRDKNTDTLYISSNIKGQKIYLTDGTAATKTYRFFSANGNYHETGAAIKSIDFKMADVSRTNTLAGFFYQLTSLVEIKNLDSLDTSHIISFADLFSVCESLITLDLSSLSTDSCTNFQSMFSNCTNLETVNLSHFNTENATSLQRFFYKCTNLKSADLSSFKTDNVTDMQFMFYECENIQSINFGNINTENVKDMRYMIYYCQKIETLDLSMFKIGNVTNMDHMFYWCKVLKTIYAQEWYKTKNSQLNSDSMFLADYQLPGYDRSKITIDYAKWQENGGYFTNPSQKPK